MANKGTQIQKQETKDIQTHERTRWGKVFSPAVDIIEAPNELKLYADLPGVDKNSIEISVDQDVLTIQGNVDYTPIEGYVLEYREYDNLLLSYRILHFLIRYFKVHSLIKIE